MDTISLDSLLYDSSRFCIDVAFSVIEAHPEQLEDMLNLCCKPYPISMRAARVMQLYSEKYPDAIIPIIHRIINELLITSVDGVKRSFLKILTFIPQLTTVEYSTLVLDKSLDWLFSDKETIAVRAYCVDVLIKFAKEEPELKNEIMLAFENLPTENDPSLKFRCLNGLKELKK